MNDKTIENYLKNIYHASKDNTRLVSNKEIASAMDLSAPTVSETVKKLDKLKLITYEKSYGVRLTNEGLKLALDIIRRHRIWETYLAKELGFGWDEVHEIAEELEHVKNDKLIKKLALILGNPIFDPHGDPIPDEEGKIRNSNFINLSNGELQKKYKLMGVTDHSTSFLKYLEKHGLTIGATLLIKSKEIFDKSIVILCQKQEVYLGEKGARCLIVEEI
jgi:DtxR family Mn-dependent transcriptional regulator